MQNGKNFAPTDVIALRMVSRPRLLRVLFFLLLLFFVYFGVIMEQKEIKIISLKYRWKTSVKKISKVQEDAKGNSFVMETCILDVCVCVEVY